MKNLWTLLETYMLVLVHPFKIHEQFRYNVTLPGHEGQVYPPLSLAESIGISWVFAILRGLGKIVFLNFFLMSFLNFQSETYPFLQDLLHSSGSSTYYFLLFSAALDIIFFPITTLVLTELWAWVIRFYSKRLNPDIPYEDVADQITTHALSSNVFFMVPYIGDVIQTFLYHFLLYAGLRSNMGASRSLAWVVLLTPTVIGFVIISLILVTVFYLMSALSF